MKGEWCYYKSYFSPEICNLIIEKTKDLSFNSGSIGLNGDTINNNIRKSEVLWIYPQDFPQLYEEMWKLEKQANEEWFGFHVDNLEYIQLARYNSTISGEYKKHQDVFWFSGTYTLAR